MDVSYGRNYGPRAWAVPLLAVLVAVVVWVVGRVTGIEPEVRAGTGTRAVGLVEVAAAALVAGVAGWGARALIRRLTGDGDRLWLGLCAVVLLASLLGPLSMASPAMAALLVAEHVAVGATIALGLSTRHRRRGAVATG